MGQRSQIYVRYDDEVYNENTRKYEPEKGLIANYYQWNYAERMVSRARHGMEWMQEMANSPWGIKERGHLIFDVNFDMGDIAVNQNLLKEWGEHFRNSDFNEFVFNQDNNDGKLLVDVSKDGTIKYAFLDGNNDLDHIMNAAEYMEWDVGADWESATYEYNGRTHERYSEEAKKALMNNIDWLDKNATQMTREEIQQFLEYDYVYPKQCIEEWKQEYNKVLEEKGITAAEHRAAVLNEDVKKAHGFVRYDYEPVIMMADGSSFNKWPDKIKNMFEPGSTEFTNGVAACEALAREGYLVFDPYAKYQEIGSTIYVGEDFEFTEKNRAAIQNILENSGDFSFENGCTIDVHVVGENGVNTFKTDAIQGYCHTEEYKEFVDKVKEAQQELKDVQERDTHKKDKGVEL